MLSLARMVRQARHFGQLSPEVWQGLRRRLIVLPAMCLGARLH